MKKQNRLTSLSLALLVGASSILTGHSCLAQGATATISGVAVSGGFDYTILLFNTGETDLNSFWYGWTQSGNNLPSIPSGATNSLGWANSVVGNSIEWVNGASTALTPGNSASFFFFSSSTPTAMTTSPAGESVAYVHGITFSQGVPGDSTGVFSPTLVVPEPSAVALFGMGSLGLLLSARRKLLV